MLHLRLIILSVVGDVPVDSEALVVTSGISRSSQLSISEALIGLDVCACVLRGEYSYVYMSVCVCTVFIRQKKTRSCSNPLVV